MAVGAEQDAFADRAPGLGDRRRDAVSPDLHPRRGRIEVVELERARAPGVAAHRACAAGPGDERLLERSPLRDALFAAAAPAAVVATAFAHELGAAVPDAVALDHRLAAAVPGATRSRPDRRRRGQIVP